MILLNPEIVRFESFAWEDATLVAVDRFSRHPIEDFGDQGPFAAFADAPEQSVHIRVQRRIIATDTDDPTLGASGTLIFYLTQPGSDLNRQRVSIPCTLTAIKCDLPTTNKPPAKTYTFIANNPDATDPVTIEAMTTDTDPDIE